MATNFEITDFFTDDSLFDDPYPYWEYIRTHKGPVWIDSRYNLAVVTGHEEEVEVLRDHATYSSCNAPTGPFPGLPVLVEGDDANPLIEEHRSEFPMHEFMVTMDPPQHDEYRSLMWRLFTPKQVKKNEDFMWHLADEQIDAFFEVGEVEFSGQYASPFTGLVIADLLGVPEEDMPRFRAWFEGQFDRIEEDGSNITGNPLTFFQDSFARYVIERRGESSGRRAYAAGGGHVLQWDSARYPGDRSRGSISIRGGPETTVRLITFSMRYLAENPDAQERLRQRRELIPNFLEEMLRLESPIKGHFRMARRSTILGGITIPAGTSIMLVNGAANRDPRRFESPCEMRFDRPNVREQLAFSRGAHSCIGQSLARSESRVTIERVLDRMADFRVSENHHGPAEARHWEYLPTWLFRGLTELHLQFTPIK